MVLPRACYYSCFSATGWEITSVNLQVGVTQARSGMSSDTCRYRSRYAFFQAAVLSFCLFYVRNKGLDVGLPRSKALIGERCLCFDINEWQTFQWCKEEKVFIDKQATVKFHIPLNVIDKPRLNCFILLWRKRKPKLRTFSQINPIFNFKK